MTNTLLTLHDPAAERRAVQRLLSAEVTWGAESGRFAADHQASAEYPHPPLDLVEARRVPAIEQTRHLRRLPAEPLGDLLLVEPGAAHRVIGFALTRSQRPPGDDQPPL